MVAANTAELEAAKQISNNAPQVASIYKFRDIALRDQWLKKWYNKAFTPLEADIASQLKYNGYAYDDIIKDFSSSGLQQVRDENLLKTWEQVWANDDDYAFFNTLKEPTSIDFIKKVYENGIQEIAKDGKFYGRFLKGYFLEIRSSTKLFGGNLIKLSEYKTTTVTGVLDDVNSVAFRGQIIDGITQMGVNNGGINILRSPKWSEIQFKYKYLLDSNDEIAFWEKVTDEFWNTVNKPWLDEAILRGDNFRFVSNPIDDLALHVTKGRTFVLDNNGNKIISIFGREINYIKSKGYSILTDGTAIKK